MIFIQGDRVFLPDSQIRLDDQGTFSLHFMHHEFTLRVN